MKWYGILVLALPVMLSGCFADHKECFQTIELQAEQELEKMEREFERLSKMGKMGKLMADGIADGSYEFSLKIKNLRQKMEENNFEGACDYYLDIEDRTLIKK